MLVSDKGMPFYTGQYINDNAGNIDDFIRKQFTSEQKTAGGFMVNITGKKVNVAKGDKTIVTGTLKDGKIIWGAVYAKLFEDGTLVLSNNGETGRNDEPIKDYGIVEDYDFDYDLESTEEPLSPIVGEDFEKVKVVNIYNKIVPQNTCAWFFECYNLTTIENISNLDTSNVTNMEMMFLDCSSLTNLDVSNFDTSNVTNMAMMLVNCSSLTNLDVSNFDTSNVTNMAMMFANCSSLTNLDISNFDTGNVTNMQQMFVHCSSLINLDISNFDTSNVTNMQQMFLHCWKLTSLDLRNFDTSNVTNAYGMVAYCSKLTSLDLSNFDTSNVTNMSSMYEGCSNLKVTVKDATALTDMQATNPPSTVTFVVKEG